MIIWLKPPAPMGSSRFAVIYFVSFACGVICGHLAEAVISHWSLVVSCWLLVSSIRHQAGVKLASGGIDSRLCGNDRTGDVP